MDQARYDVGVTFDRSSTTPITVSDFNPYREWLGIKTAGSVSYYQLLGVRREDCNDRIREQATRLVRMLKQIDAGEHETEKRQLIDRVRRAAKRLMDPELRRAYDRGLAKQARAEKPQAAPGRKSANRVKPAEEVVDAVTASPVDVSERHEPFVEQADFVAGPTEVDADPQRDCEPSSDHESKSELVAKRDTAVRHEPGRTVTDELLRLRPRKSNIAPAYKAVQRRSRSMTITLLLAAVSICGIGYLLLTQTQLGQQCVAAALQTIAGSEGQTVSDLKTDKHSTEFDDDVPPLHNDQIEPSANSSFAIESVTGSELPNLVKPRPIDPTPAMNLGELPDAPELLKSLQQAKRLLSERKTAEAKQVLADARKFATHPVWRARHARMTTLTSYVASYWDAAHQQIASFRAGNEVVIGDTPVMIVESSETKLIIRNQGRNQTVDRANLSQDLAETLADGWLDEDAPSTKVFRGAMMAVTPGHDASEGRKLWQEAEASGELKLRDLNQVFNELTEY